MIDWFEPWPEPALESVAAAFLAEDAAAAEAAGAAPPLPDELRPAVVAHMVAAHRSVVAASARFEARLRRPNHVTPRSYLDFVATYRRLLREQLGGNKDQAARLAGGLSKLEQAASEVAGLQEELGRARAVVRAATEECDRLISEIATSTADAEARQAAAVEKEDALRRLAAQIEVEKAEAEAALSEAMPALEEAAAALGDLKRDDITEIRSFAKPHVLVQKVLLLPLLWRQLDGCFWGWGFLEGEEGEREGGFERRRIREVHGLSSS